MGLDSIAGLVRFVAPKIWVRSKPMREASSSSSMIAWSQGPNAGRSGRGPVQASNGFMMLALEPAASW